MSLKVSLSLKLSLMFSFDFQHFNRDTTTKLILNDYICTFIKKSYKKNFLYNYKLVFCNIFHCNTCFCSLIRYINEFIRFINECLFHFR